MIKAKKYICEEYLKYVKKRGDILHTSSNVLDTNPGIIRARNEFADHRQKLQEEFKKQSGNLDPQFIVPLEIINKFVEEHRWYTICLSSSSLTISYQGQLYESTHQPAQKKGIFEQFLGQKNQNQPISNVNKLIVHTQDELKSLVFKDRKVVTTISSLHKIPFELIGVNDSLAKKVAIIANAGIDDIGPTKHSGTTIVCHPSSIRFVLDGLQESQISLDVEHPMCYSTMEMEGELYAVLYAGWEDSLDISFLFGNVKSKSDKIGVVSQIAKWLCANNQQHEGKSIEDLLIAFSELTRVSELKFGKDGSAYGSIDSLSTESFESVYSLVRELYYFYTITSIDDKLRENQLNTILSHLARIKDETSKATIALLNNNRIVNIEAILEPLKIINETAPHLITKE